MNKIIIFLASCSLLSLASSGGLYSTPAHSMYEQDLHPNHMVTFSHFTQQDFMRQKFVLDMLFRIQDRLENGEQLLKEYGIMEIQAMQPEMFLKEMDEQMRYMMDLCNKCTQMNMAGTYSLSYNEELRQIMGLYKLFVSARDFETFQQISVLARKCFMGKIFTLAFVSAMRDRQDAKTLILPEMYEVNPEAYYTEADMEEIELFLAEHKFNSMNMQTAPQAYDESYLWMWYREMRRQFMMQKMSGKMGYVPMPVNLQSEKNIVFLNNKMQNKDTMQLFMEDLDLKTYVDSMIGQMMRLMNQDGEEKKEPEMRMRDYMQGQYVHKQGKEVSDSHSSHMNNMHTSYDLYNTDMEYKRGMNKDNMYMNGRFPIRNAYDEQRVLYGGRRPQDYSMNQAYNWPYYMMSQRNGMKSAHSVVDAADPRGLEALDDQNAVHATNEYKQHPYSYYLEQQHNKMLSQMKMGSPYDKSGMRYRRSTEMPDKTMYQSVRILLHNIRQLMTRIRMERISMGESETMMQNMGMSNVHYDLDRMRAIRLNKMGLDTRQSRLLLDHFREMEMNIEHEIQMQMENGHELWDIERVVLNLFTGKIQGVNIMQMLEELQKDMMPQSNSQFTKKIGYMKRTIYRAVMMHFLMRMDSLMQQYQQKYEQLYEVSDLMFPSVTISQLKVDKLRTFIDQRDDDLVNMMDCKDMKSCLEEGKIMYARQPKLNHKSFEIQMRMNSESTQNVIMRIFLAPQMDADFMLMDTRVFKLQQGKNDIKFKSSDIMWTRNSRVASSYSQYYKHVMQYMQKTDTVSFTRKENCHFPHHLLLPRGHYDGLPMKLIVVVSPMEDANMPLEQDRMICAMGIGKVGMNQQFYDFRLNRYIKNSNDMNFLTSMPNIYAQDVLIYHE